MFHQGDSLLVNETLFFERYSVFTVDGVFRRALELKDSAALDSVGTPPTQARLYQALIWFEDTYRFVSHAFGDGSLLYFDVRVPQGKPESGVKRDSVRLFRVALNGRVLTEYGPLFAHEEFRQFEEFDTRTLIFLPPGASRCSGEWPGCVWTTDAFRPRSMFATRGSELLQAPGDYFGFQVFDEHGKLTRIVRVPHVRRPVTDADIATVREAAFRRIKPGDDRKKFEPYFNSMKFPKEMPASDRMIVDARGNVWLQRFAITRDSVNSWGVFDPKGRFLGEVATPRHLIISEIGSDYVLGISIEESGAELVVVYPIIHPDTQRE
jgi:hypothetical protein